MLMHGADADALRATAERFVESSERLRGHRAELTSAFRTTPWAGADADRSRAEWQEVSLPALARTSRFMEDLGQSLLRHADDQQHASAARSPGSPSVLGHVADTVDDAVADVIDGVGDVVEGVLDDVEAIFERLLGGLVDGPAAPPAPPSIEGLRPTTFVSAGDARADLVAAMGGLGDESRVRRDEIEIRALDNGRYVVVLPGVTDLSEGFDQFAEQVRRDGLFGAPRGARDAYDSWADNDEPTVRKMRYAYEAALRDDTTVNEYSTAVVGALQRAGVPAGADVMIVGHSFGAYTAIDLAVEPTFNIAAGASNGYRVNVTHVVAAGAETDWRFDEVPSATNTLVLNNRWDAVYQAENLLHPNASPTEPGHVEEEFWGGREGYGHDEQNYIDWLGRTDDRDVELWFRDVNDRYSAGGTRVSVQVPDPNVR
jgi:hypothetical protein